ncbi:HPr family phosphocarrier protein [Amycolatopsis suaedae]|uniref:Phosphocarrier protein HPr n=1 Tax=Amycolatopsis suaedae TaxID=2510978 RepID=A0A4Q7J5M7_9PSEU|nr:HPr family phosphocarrier protein [Amycolatopsis suaedae]RZQ62417.1 HPr family phosphocarrier protein [Amycolatopsis suaedae]
MPSKQVVVASRIGLHARPAAVVAKTAGEQEVKVRISAGDRPAVDAGSLISILALGVSGGDTVTIEAEGPGAEEALEAVAAVLTTDLDDAPAKAASA